MRVRNTYRRLAWTMAFRQGDFPAPVVSQSASPAGWGKMRRRQQLKGNAAARTDHVRSALTLLGDFGPFSVQLESLLLLLPIEKELARIPSPPRRIRMYTGFGPSSRQGRHCL